MGSRRVGNPRCGRCLRDYITEMNMVQEGRETVAHLCHLEKREWRGRANILEKDKFGAVVMGKVRDRQLITRWMRMMVTGRECLILGGIKSLAEILGLLEGTIKPFMDQAGRAWPGHGFPDQAGRGGHGHGFPGEHDQADHGGHGRGFPGGHEADHGGHGRGFPGGHDQAGHGGKGHGFSGGHDQGARGGNGSGPLEGTIKAFED